MVLILGSFTGHIFVQADVDNAYTPLSPLPDLGGQGLQSGSSLNFDTYVTYLFNTLIGLGAVAAVLMITWGGFEYMTSDAINGKKEGVSKIKNAIYGLLLVLSSVLILRTINPQFVEVPPGLVPAANLDDVDTNYMSSLEQQLPSLDAKAQASANRLFADQKAGADAATIAADQKAVVTDTINYNNVASQITKPTMNGGYTTANNLNYVPGMPYTIKTVPAPAPTQTSNTLKSTTP